VELVADGLRAGLKEENPAQPLGDAFDAEAGIFLLELNDLFGDRRRQLRFSKRRRRVGLEAFLTERSILTDPVREGLLADAGLLEDELA